MDKLLDIYGYLKLRSNKYRSAPFWAWNDKLDPEELTRQIRGMKEQGMGGFFIHSREGLETEYLSDEWMNCVSVSIDEANKSGLEAWIYDEDKWPSGSAGGLVSAANPGQFTAKALTAELVFLSEHNYQSVLSDLKQSSDILSVYRVCFNNKQTKVLTSFLLLENYDNLDYIWPQSLLVCRMETSGHSEWYNGLAPSDNLNPMAVQSFLNLTHEKYKSRFGGSLGKSVKGVFTDEPNFCDFFSHFAPGRPWLPWSTVLEDYFEKKRGYSILDILPLLFFHGDGEEKGRYDYWLSLTELFVSSYTQQIYKWCDENKLQLTGHMLYENDLGYSVRVSGASMPHYRFMHAPGIDILADQRQEYLTVKQCTSVANQFGRETVVSETYGCTGWDFSFAGQKRLGDWQFVMGVNKRCQHLALYSLSGCRKRDYPPSFNYNTSWWPYNHVIEDYFARLAVCTTSGKVHRKILCLHPMGTFWMKTGSSISEDLNNIQMNMGWQDEHILALNKEGEVYNQLAGRLLMSQFDFDFGDEIIIKQDAFIDGAEFKIGVQAYNIVIVPRVETIMESTVKLLEEFLVAGGTVFWVKPIPDFVDAVKTDRLSRMLKLSGIVLADDYADLLSLLSVKVERPLQICDEFGRDADGFLSMVRHVEDGMIITVVNTNTLESIDSVLKIAGTGKITSYDLLADRTRTEKVSLNSDTEGSSMILPVSFSPSETKVFFINQNEKSEVVKFSPRYNHPHSVKEVIMGFSPVASVSLTMENALTLDRCCFRIADGSWSHVSEVWQGQRVVREKLGMCPIYYNGAPQRYSWVGRSGAKSSVSIGMRFYFYVDYIPDAPVFAVVEKSGDFRIMCNDQECFNQNDYYIDRSMMKHRIPSLQKGENILELFIDYQEDIELEDVYIVGDFGISPERRIIKTPKTLQRGDWCFQGLYHYPGSVRYQYDLPALDKIWENKPLFLKIGAFAGILAVIRINDVQPVYVFQGDSCISVDGFLLTDRENRVEIEIVGSLRNLLGPFHRSVTACSRISWEDFRTEGAAYTPEYSIVPSGLLGEIMIIAGKL